jgi:hypothetical protein
LIISGAKDEKLNFWPPLQAIWPNYGRGQVSLPNAKKSGGSSRLIVAKLTDDRLDVL